MKNIADNIRLYVSAWNEKTPEAIKAILLACCEPNITYTDKQTPQFSGIDALVDLIMNSYQLVPGRVITLQSEPEYFDGHAYYGWGIIIPGVGERAGRDYMIYDENHRIVEIVGFLPVS
ncbi:hypothetical protein [Mucilaginibacter celer]|uniref:Nuclear transport factor 2 family protein n=1 Tax=Mucilaginibacter celer TaxID=2305508 RepID=A0A494VKU7_9SPHI|nr:hypothetical protein [Mucilaginibacter celer]AYL95826.1 hypothetical protein HYN43_011235 [Mucilaginibacter celer]